MKRIFLPLLLLAVAAGCGPKRPPAVSTGSPGAGGTPSGGYGSGAATDSVDAGPDIQAVDSGAIGEGDLSDASGEGGPLADIRFDYDSPALTDEAQATLQRHAEWLRARPGLRVTVEGHCDERGTVEYNLALGDQRARATSDYLVSLGVDAGRLARVSLGKERPLDTSSSEGAWARNRRAHFVVAR